MTNGIEIGHHSSKGLRTHNEDWAAIALPPVHETHRGVVAAIADGVSTGGGGREAAQTAVLSVVGDFHSAPRTWDTSVVLDRLISAQNGWLADHNRRRQAGGEGPHARIGLTTLTVLVLRGPAWTVAHVGDTRAWLVRADQCVQLTEDHAYTEAFQRSRLTRAVGLDHQVHIDYEHGEAVAGDIFVLTSDGVHGPLPRARIAELAREGSAQEASEAIVQAALAAGSADNLTAVVVRVRTLLAGRFDDLLPGLRGLPAPPRLRVGDVLDGYRIEDVLSGGGVHQVLRAADSQGAPVIVKALIESRADDLEERAMLAHEAWLAERLTAGTAPHGEAAFVRARPLRDPSAYYAVFDWHDGQTLEQRLQAGEAFDIAQIVDGTLAVVRALGRLHRHGVIHRDIKPGNLHLGDDGRWRVLDLGAALSGQDPPSLRVLRAGTPSYMNPEQWGLDGAEPLPADAASDVYALGVTLYEWLTRQLPYGTIEPYQTGRYRRDPKPPSRLRPDVPMWLDHLVQKAVALDPRQRFETAEEMQLALERGAARPLTPQARTPLASRDPTALWKIALSASLLFNILLIYWLLFLPR